MCLLQRLVQQTTPADRSPLQVLPRLLLVLNIVLGDSGVKPILSDVANVQELPRHLFEQLCSTGLLKDPNLMPGRGERNESTRQRKER